MREIPFCVAILIFTLNTCLGDAGRPDGATCSAYNSPAVAVSTASTQVRPQKNDSPIHHVIRFRNDPVSHAETITRFNPQYPSIPVEPQVRQSWRKSQWGWD